MKMKQKVLLSLAFVLLLGLGISAKSFAAEVTNDSKGSKETVATGTQTESSVTVNSDTEQPEVSPSPTPEVKNGFVKENGKTYYYVNGVKKKGWLRKGSKKYFFSRRNAAMVTGKKKIDKYTYYFSGKGVMQTGIKEINGKKYYFAKKSGRMLTGKQKIKNNLYYMNKKGVIQRIVYGKKKMVALTYDDGPSYFTDDILDILKKHNQVATFFVVGSRVNTYKKQMKRAYDMGCQIGNHTYDHTILTSAGNAKIKSQIKKTNVAIKKITGEKVVIMRPPGGGYNSSVGKAVNMPMILWSVDTRDWATRNATSTKNKVLKDVKDGDIVLMHDLYEPTAKASKTIIPKLVKKGYQLVTVSELAELRGKKMKAKNAYFDFYK
ncbi:MAG: polysaccharide deacetylase family protein [Lachnospiraceae bacterium]|nr:polysaccharide deacetylase family protein [Lachnospiraceae bacterium]